MVNKDEYNVLVSNEVNASFAAEEYISTVCRRGLRVFHLRLCSKTVQRLYSKLQLVLLQLCRLPTDVFTTVYLCACVCLVNVFFLLSLTYRFSTIILFVL